MYNKEVENKLLNSLVTLLAQHYQIKDIPTQLKTVADLVLVKQSDSLRNWNLSLTKLLAQQQVNSSECCSEEFLFLFKGQSSTVPGVCEYLSVLDQPDWEILLTLGIALAG